MVAISHNHYDHLDTPTLYAIYAKQASNPPALLIPLNTTHLVKSIAPAELIREADWWEEVSVSSQRGDATFTYTPAQHMTARTAFDMAASLWGGWCVKTKRDAGAQTVWFAGDTGELAVGRAVEKRNEEKRGAGRQMRGRGSDIAPTWKGARESKLTTDIWEKLGHTLTPGYCAVDEETYEIDDSRPVCPAFKEIGNRLGPIDLAFVPIGAYSSRWFLSTVHCAPIDAVRVFKDVVSDDRSELESRTGRDIEQNRRAISVSITSLAAVSQEGDGRAALTHSKRARPSRSTGALGTCRSSQFPSRLAYSSRRASRSGLPRSRSISAPSAAA